MGNNRNSIRVESIDVLRDVLSKLSKFSVEMNDMYHTLKNDIQKLEDSDEWNDRHHTEFMEEYMPIIESQISRVSSSIENDVEPYLIKFIERAEEVGF